MANTTKVHDMILKEGKYTFLNSCPFIGSMNRDYDGTREAFGVKAGEAIRIRKPIQFTARSGKTMDVQDSTETNVTLTQSVIRGIDIKFSWAEMAQDISKFNELYIRPAANILASTVEAYCHGVAVKEVPNAVTLPVTAIGRDDVANAAAELTKFSTPESDRFMVICPNTQADLLNANSSIFNPTAEISRQYTEGYMGKIYGFSTAVSNNLASITNTADVAGAVDGASQTGASLTVDALTTAPIAGMIIQSIGDDVFGLNPVTQESLGDLQKFVLRDTATQSTTNLDIYPSITATGNQKTVSAVPDNNDVITFMGSASTAYRRNMCYHKNTFAFGTTKLAVPRNLTSSTSTDGNLALTLTSGGDINNMDEYMRLNFGANSEKSGIDNRAKSVNAEIANTEVNSEVKSQNHRNAYQMNLNFIIENIILARVSDTLTAIAEGENVC